MGKQPGRWRDSAKDDKIFFEIVGAGAQLRIIDTRPTERPRSNYSIAPRSIELAGNGHLRG